MKVTPPRVEGEKSRGKMAVCALRGGLALASLGLALLLFGCTGLYERYVEPPHLLVSKRYPGKARFLLAVRAEVAEDPFDHADAPAPPPPAAVERLVCRALEGTAYRCLKGPEEKGAADLRLVFRYDLVQPLGRRRGPLLFRRPPGFEDEPLDYGASFQWSFTLRDARTGEELFVQTEARMNYEGWDYQVAYWINRLFGGKGYRGEGPGVY